MILGGEPIANRRQRGTFPKEHISTQDITIQFHFFIKMMKKILLIMAVGFCLYGCVNYQAAWKIRKKYDKAYNGVDTLININGYYYSECLPNVCNPTVFTENGAFYALGGFYHWHGDIYEFFKRYKPTDNEHGYFVIANDTIIARYVFRYQPTCYDLHEIFYKILDEETLLLFKGISNVNGMVTVNRFDHVYKFHPHKVTWKNEK